MASLERHGQTYRIVFRFRGRKFRLTLKTESERQALSDLYRFEEVLRLIELGTLDAPPDGVDPGLYILSGGKIKDPELAKAKPPVTLGELFESYRSNFPRGAKEEDTRVTESIHLGHLARLVGDDVTLDALTTEVLQRYIGQRSREKGHHGQTVSRDTIRKEIATLAAVWNRWAIPQGMATGPAPTKGLVYPKARTKPPFQTRAQIERQVARGGLSAAEVRELWDALYLEQQEVAEFLAYIGEQASRSRRAYIYPLFALAAHTGARRSELLRSRVDDIDLAQEVITIREKKRDRSRELTFRRVPLTPFLKAALVDWLATHPGGQLTFCEKPNRPLKKNSVARLFRWIVSDSKWDVLRGWHVLRHSFCSNCAARGVDQRIIDEWMGHETEEMRRRYRHLFPDVQRQAIEKVFA